MTTVSVSPQYPVKGRELSAFFALTEPTANFVRVWCVGAPDGSALATKINAAASSNAREQIYASDGGDDHPWRIKLDKGGDYTFRAQEYVKGTGFGGGFEGDTRANQVETPIGSEAALTISVGQRVDYSIGVPPDLGRLVFYAFAGTIRETTDATHGEQTPSIVSTTTGRAGVAAKNEDVLTALSALADVSVDDAFGNISSIVQDIHTAYSGHIEDGANGVHLNIDTTNTIDPTFASSPSPNTLVSFVTKAAQMFRQHMTNDSGTGIGSGSATPFHSDSGATVADLLSLPVVRGVGNPEDAYSALADLWRSLHSHRGAINVHEIVDSFHVQEALPPLLEVHRRFFEVLAMPSPDAVVGDGVGIALLKTWGAKVT